MSRPLYIIRDGHRTGPFSEEKLEGMVRQGQVMPGDICQRFGDHITQRVRDVLPESVPLDNDPPPAHPPPAREPRTAPRPRRRQPPTDPRPVSSEPEIEEPPVRRRPRRARPPEDEIRFEEPEEPREDEFEDAFEDEEEEDPDRTVWHGHPSLISYRTPWAVSVGVSLLGAALHPVHIGFTLLAFAVSFAIICGILIVRATRDYIVTPLRIEFAHGILSRSSREVRVGDVRAINVRTEGLLGVFGVGNVEFDTAGNDDVEVVFRNVWRAHRVKMIVRELQDLPIASQ